MANRKHRCIQCGGWDHEVGQISRSGLCSRCGDRRLVENIEAMQTKSGPIFEEWRSRSARVQYERAQRELRRMGELPDPSSPTA